MNKKVTPERSSGVSLNVFIARAGVCSRRKAGELIKAGLVTVNNFKITDPSYKVTGNEQVRVKGKPIKKEAFVYVLLNKPTGVITSVADERGRPTVLGLVAPIKKRLYPVGRLDLDTSGLLLLTNDGELTQRLAHPRFMVKKAYRVVLDRPLTPPHLEQIRKGVRLKDGRINVDQIKCVPKTACSVVDVVLHSGKYRIIRRLFESIGYTVTSLDRVKYAQLTKRGLRPGQWRYLSSKEIEELKAL